MLLKLYLLLSRTVMALLAAWLFFGFNALSYYLLYVLGASFVVIVVFYLPVRLTLVLIHRRSWRPRRSSSISPRLAAFSLNSLPRRFYTPPICERSQRPNSQSCVPWMCV